jgi:hypothetical protein
VLRGHHVGVFVLRKMSVHTVAGLAGFSVADVVGEDDVVAGDVEELAGTVEDAGKLRREKISTPAAGAVEYEDGIGDAAVGVAGAGAKGAVVQAQLGEGLAGFEVEIVRDEVAFEGLVGARGAGAGGRGLGYWRRGLLRARGWGEQRYQRYEHR